jgi:hypothetical protein
VSRNQNSYRSERTASVGHCSKDCRHLLSSCIQRLGMSSSTRKHRLSSSYKTVLQVIYTRRDRRDESMASANVHRSIVQSRAGHVHRMDCSRTLIICHAHNGQYPNRSEHSKDRVKPPNNIPSASRSTASVVASAGLADVSISR